MSHYSTTRLLRIGALGRVRACASGLAVHISGTPGHAGPADLVTFLGIAQSLQIDFLPITWQHGLGKIGEGATREIREALLDTNTSFAFKRRSFGRPLNIEELKGQILPTLVAEISILHIPSIRNCRNIIDLVGICWEVYCEDDYTMSREKPVWTLRGRQLSQSLYFKNLSLGICTLL